MNTNTPVTDEMVNDFIKTKPSVSMSTLIRQWEAFKSQHSMSSGEGKGDWEIASFKHKQNDAQLLTLHENGIHYYWNYSGINKNAWQLDDILNSVYFDIHSVRRLGDNPETFTVGDEVEWDLNQLPGRMGEAKFTIKSFNIFHDRMFVNNKNICIDYLSKTPIPVKPELAFVGEDGKNIYKGDRYAYVPKETLAWINVSDGKSYPLPKESFLYFSTEQAAQTFVVENKRCLSVKDVLSLDLDIKVGYGKSAKLPDECELIIFQPKSLKQLVQSKIQLP